ncbi:hypothetical protein ACFODZ_13295 [Marinicella sediminis]|uniref:DUF945 family protein n=1 Tax=Marinicella sediminis TaxID=1792834 RepID=A0ABV7JIM2_9GAMM|nr:hypothetical protein [Marinicella sediminis]
MRHQTKIILIIIILAMVAIPYWRINKNSTFFVEGLMGHLSHLGEWNNQGVSTSLNGKITTRNLSFTPKGAQQSINIQSMQVHTDIKKLLLSGSRELVNNVPGSSTMSLKNITFSGNASDFSETVRGSGYWPMVMGFLGAFGCADGSNFTFSEQQWKQLFPQQPTFNIEVTYSLIDDYHIDFNLNIDSLNNWYIVWSGTLTRRSDVPRITFDDAIIETLYYYHVDQGFNKRRNDMCASANNNSFAAYRLNSAEQVQKYLRVYAEQEMSQVLSNQYQRSLAEDIELNAIFKLREPKFLYEFAHIDQQQMLAMSDIEVALGENEYQSIELDDIDFLELDMETLREEMEAKDREAARKEAEANKPRELLKTIRRTIGGTSQNEQFVDNWEQAIGLNIRVKTKRGRPIFGKLISISPTHLTISTRYMRGNATITVANKDVISMTTSSR